MEGKLCLKICFYDKDVDTLANKRLLFSKSLYIVWSNGLKATCKIQRNCSLLERHSGLCVITRTAMHLTLINLVRFSFNQKRNMCGTSLKEHDLFNSLTTAQRSFIFLRKERLTHLQEAASPDRLLESSWAFISTSEKKWKGDGEQQSNGPLVSRP